MTWEPDQGRYYNFAGQPAPAYLGWYPDLNAGTYTGQAQGPWSVTGNSNYIVLGGEFTRVNNTNQQGLVRFAVSSIAPDVKGPKLFNANYPLNVTSTAARHGPHQLAEQRRRRQREPDLPGLSRHSELCGSEAHA